MKTNNSNKNVTKVICANCGAEILIPANEVQGVVGTVIGKDSGLGTVVLPTVEGACGCATKSGKMTKKAAFAQLEALAQVNPGMKQMVEVIMGQIDEGGYIDVKNIVRRWIPSQCLSMLFSKDGFHRALTKKGYAYSWEVVLAEFKKQVKLLKDKDSEGLEDRQRWYNKSVVIDMVEHYIDALKNAMEHMFQRKHNGRAYIRLTCWLNSGKGVHVDEFHKVLEPLYNAQMSVAKAKGIEETMTAIESFIKIKKSIKNWEPKEQAPSFMNAYKAAGAYYTMKDLILFENCKMKTDRLGCTDDPGYFSRKDMKFVNREKSLEALENKVKDVMESGMNDFGYMMLGLLKSFLNYNGFDYADTKKSWAAASDQRRAARQAKKSTRRTRK